jgi:glutathione peroxidase
MKFTQYRVNIWTIIVLWLVMAAASVASVLDHTVRALNAEQTVNLSEVYGGQVVLVVNTASRCAFTRQYEGLERLYSTYRDRGFAVLGFPSNDFGSQEPGTERQIQNFCRLTYGVQFPMFAKTGVREGGASPLFQELGEAAGRFPQWNFHKYLVGRDGQLIADFSSATKPESDAVVSAIEGAL